MYDDAELREAKGGDDPLFLNWNFLMALHTILLVGPKFAREKTMDQYVGQLKLLEQQLISQVRHLVKGH